MAKKYTHDQLNELYLKSEQCDHDHFAEGKSNILLVGGLHYQKPNSKFWGRIKDQKNVGETAKLRLTQNHIGTISSKFQNNIIAQAPGTRVFPKIEAELQSQKAAELSQAVWEHIKEKINFREWRDKRVSDFSDIGEVATKLFFDPNKGRLIGYKQKVSIDPETGVETPEVDELGHPVASDKPVFAGELVFETIYAYNLLRDPQAKTMEDSPYLINRKMVPIEELKRLVEGDEEKQQFISESADDTYKVFDGNTGGYTDTKGQDMLREFFFRPCYDYPNGYYYLQTSRGILAEGEIPFGIYPIEWQGFKESQGTPRAKSWIKDARPFQVEINRCASAIATAQVSWGDDKLVTAAGAKMTRGVDQPGIRHIQVSGPPPTVIPGRSGEQYVAWMEMNISNLYKALNVEEDAQEKQSQNANDMFSNLFRSAKDKQRYAKQALKFESFLVRVHKKALLLAKEYYTEHHLIPAVGKKEYINIAEFKQADDLSTQIKVEPMSEDFESTFGKQLSVQHVLQYVGKDISAEDRGKLIRCMPFLNKEEMLDDITIDYDNATSDILALDRGEWRPPNRYDNHKYLIKRLIKRIKQSDFKSMHPAIQKMYEDKLRMHEEVEVQMAQEILAAQADFIPASGYEVVCDLYAPDPANPAKTRRLRIPSEALEWLVKRLEQQGTYTVGLTEIPQGGVADMAKQLQSNHVTGPQSQSSDIARRNGPGGLNGNSGSFNNPGNESTINAGGNGGNAGTPSGAFNGSGQRQIQ